MAYIPGGGGIRVKEVDGAPDVATVTTLVVTNASLTDDGAGQVTLITGAGSTGGGYATVAEEGSNLTQRTLLNFIGDGVTAVDNSGASRTDVTITDAMVLIADTTLGADAADITFSSIPGTYKHLLLVVQARGDAAAGSVMLLARFNADTGANYDHQGLSGAETTAGAFVAHAGTSMRCGHLPAGTAPASAAGPAEIMIPNYAATTFHKQLLSRDHVRYNTSSQTIELIGGNWRSTAAITEIKLFAATGNLLAASRATLWGLS